MLDQIPEGEQFEVIDPDAIVDIRMSTGFYNKVQSAMQFLTKDKTPEQMEAIYAEIKSEKIVNPETDMFQTFFVLLKEFQQQAHKGGFVSKKSRAEIEKMLKERFPETDIEAAVPGEDLFKKAEESGEFKDSEPEQHTDSEEEPAD